MADQRALTASALPSLDKSHHPEAYQEAEHNMGGWIPCSLLGSQAFHWPPT